MDPEEISAALDLAIERFYQERFRESNTLLFNVISSGAEDSFTLFCVGRNLFYNGDITNAAEWFTRSLNTPPEFRWTHYEFGRLLVQQGDLLRGSNHFTLFCQSYKEDGAQVAINQTHVKTILDAGHSCFMRSRPDAVRLYQAFSALGFRDYLAELRIIEDQIDTGQLAAADRGFVALEGLQSFDAWGEFALARLRSAQERVEEALSAVYRAIATAPNDTFVKLTAAHTLLAIKQLKACEEFIEKAIRPLQASGKIADSQVNELCFRLAVGKKDHMSILGYTRSLGFLDSLADWITSEALFIFALPGEQISQLDIEVATEVSTYLIARQPHTLGAVLALYQFYSRRRMWESIQRLEDLIKNDDIFKHDEVIMRRFEVLCAQSKLFEATEFYKAHYSSRALNQWESCVVLRFLSESGMWIEAGSLLREFIGHKFYFPDGDFFLLKLCRKVDCHQDIIALIDTFSTESMPAEYKSLRRGLSDDLAVREAANISSYSSGLTISNHNQWGIKTEPGIGEKVCAFMCSDRAYFLSLMTFLSSYTSCAGNDNGIVWRVFLDNDVPLSWHTSLQDFATSINLNLTIFTEGAIMQGNPVHINEYGIFTGGNTLSRAAFFRIYAARYLADLGYYERLVYFDSDIIVQRQIDRLIKEPFDGALVMARLEEPSPEVQDVAKMHGLENSKYFNSGVLVFNSADSDLQSTLDIAIHLSENEPSRLVFHDQCALNIAFKNRVSYIGKNLNYFIRPHRPDNGDFSAASLIHFLDKPKPWDVTYTREYRILWLRHIGLVRSLLSRKDYSQFVAAANGHKLV